MTEIRKVLPQGKGNFAEMIRGQEGNGVPCYCVDRTDLIRDLLEQPRRVNQIPRPPRFGRTLTLSMLKEFLSLHAEGVSLPGRGSHPL